MKPTRAGTNFKVLTSIVEKYRDQLVTQRLNKIYGAGGESSNLDSKIAALQHRTHCQWKALVRRGEIWWASLPDPVGSGPGFRRPLLR